MALKDIKTVNPAFQRNENTNVCLSKESKGRKMKKVWKCSTLPIEGMKVFYAARGGRGSVPRCPLRAWKCFTYYTLPMEGMEVFHAASGGCGKVPRCLWRVWKCSTCSTLPVEGVEVFQAARVGHGSVSRCPWREWKCSTMPVEGMEVFHAAGGGRGSVSRFFQMSNIYIFYLRNFITLEDIVNGSSFF